MALALGSPLPAFTLPGTDGCDHGPGSGRPIVVAFWCNHCPYVRAWEARFCELARDVAGRVDVLAINPNDARISPGDSFEAMVERASEQDYPFPYLHDRTQDVARAFGAARTPEVFAFDAGGSLRYHGAIDDSRDGEPRSSYLRDALAAIAADEAPATTSTLAQGCTIKWSA